MILTAHLQDLRGKYFEKMVEENLTRNKGTCQFMSSIRFLNLTILKTIFCSKRAIFFFFSIQNQEFTSASLSSEQREEVQHYRIDYFQLYFHLALDHLYRQSFRDLHYLSLSSAAVINLALDISLNVYSNH